MHYKEQNFPVYKMLNKFLKNSFEKCDTQSHFYLSFIRFLLAFEMFQKQKATDIKIIHYNIILIKLFEQEN